MRPIIPRERHPLLFQTFDDLAVGESFELVNDHDPKPLYYQSWPNDPASWDGNTWRKVRRPGVYCSPNRGLTGLAIPYRSMSSDNAGIMLIPALFFLESELP